MRPFIGNAVCLAYQAGDGLVVPGSITGNVDYPILESVIICPISYSNLEVICVMGLSSAPAVG